MKSIAGFELDTFDDRKRQSNNNIASNVAGRDLFVASKLGRR
jgi:hypothetical protein